MKLLLTLLIGCIGQNVAVPGILRAANGGKPLESLTVETKWWPWNSKPEVKTPNATLSPVILVPGLGGSHLEGKLDNRPHSDVRFCEKNKDWFDLWVNVDSLLPISSKCWAENMRLEYNEQNNTYSNFPGVSVRAPGFGSTKNIEYLDPSKLPPTAYFHAMAEALVDSGYEREVSLRGAPYDFRFSSNQQGEWMKNFTSLIEETYGMNNDTPVTLIAHSMGNIYTWSMLKDKSQEWKDKYINSFISVSAPWAGSADSFLVTVSGSNEQIPTLDPLTMRTAQRTWPSIYSLFPNKNLMNQNHAIVKLTTKEGNNFFVNKTYTLSSLENLYADMNYTIGYEIYLQNKAPFESIPSIPPGVKMHCIYGIGEDTKESAEYDASRFPDVAPRSYKYTDGDGTVPRQSAELSRKWVSLQYEDITFQALPKETHMGILASKAFIKAMKLYMGL